jgi:toxin ParE1/3/4
VKRVVVLPPAREEIRAAVRWYEAQRTGLGVELLAVIDEAFEKIAARPTASPLWRTDRRYRKRLVRRFPYTVFFEVDDEIVTIVAVAHQRCCVAELSGATARSCNFHGSPRDPWVPTSMARRRRRQQAARRRTANTGPPG